MAFGTLATLLVVMRMRAAERHLRFQCVLAIALAAAAAAHAQAGLAAVTGEHYEGGHWLGSFAVYLTTQRGLEQKHATER